MVPVSPRPRHQWRVGRGLQHVAPVRFDTRAASLLALLSATTLPLAAHAADPAPYAVAQKLPLTAVPPDAGRPEASPGDRSSPLDVSPNGNQNTTGSSAQETGGPPTPISNVPRVGLFPELGKLLLDRGFDFHGIVLDRASTFQGAGVRTHESNHLLAIAPTLDVDLGKAARITGGNIHAAVTFNTLRANEPNFVEFVAMSEAAWAKGITVVHSLGGISIDLRGNRAVSQAKMTISQRSRVEGVLCDVTCTGRFYDFLEKRNSKWGIALRMRYKITALLSGF